MKLNLDSKIELHGKFILMVSSRYNQLSLSLFYTLHPELVTQAWAITRISFILVYSLSIQVLTIEIEVT